MNTQPAQSAQCKKKKNHTLRLELHQQQQLYLSLLFSEAIKLGTWVQQHDILLHSSASDLMPALITFALLLRKRYRLVIAASVP